jgi:hypothetical protein
VAGHRFQREVEGPHRPPCREIGRDQRAAAEQHAFAMHGGLDGEGGGLEAHAAFGVDAVDAGLSQPCRPVDAKSVSNRCGI